MPPSHFKKIVPEEMEHAHALPTAKRWRVWLNCTKARKRTLTAPTTPQNTATWHTPGGREMEFFLQVLFLVQNKSFFQCSNILSVGGSDAYLCLVGKMVCLWKNPLADWGDCGKGHWSLREHSEALPFFFFSLSFCFGS